MNAGTNYYIVNYEIMCITGEAIRWGNIAIERRSDDLAGTHTAIRELICAGTDVNPNSIRIVGVFKL